MKKFIFTFGSGQLKSFAVIPTNIMLVIEAENEKSARDIVFQSKIGKKFCTSYPYESVVEQFVCDYGMDEISLKELLARDRSEEK